jgi:hypothetical protein
LSDSELVELILIAIKVANSFYKVKVVFNTSFQIAKVFGTPQDIEWVFGSANDVPEKVLFCVQSRPISAFSFSEVCRYQSPASMTENVLIHL